MAGTDAVARAREYYRALDAGDYDALAGLLAAGFVQERPDATLEGRERFVRFMREERPRTHTTHAVDTVYVPGDDGTRDTDGVEEAGSGVDRGPREVAVRGRLHTADGDLLARFVDVFAVGEEGFERLDTYTL